MHLSLLIMDGESDTESTVYGKINFSNILVHREKSKLNKGKDKWSISHRLTGITRDDILHTETCIYICMYVQLLISPYLSL